MIGHVESCWGTGVNGWGLMAAALVLPSAAIAQEQISSVAAAEAVPAVTTMSAGRLAKGTVLELMVLNEVSSRTAQPGMRIVLRLNKPLLIDGKLVLAEGTPVFGEVLDTKMSGSAGSRGQLSARLTHIQNGTQRIPVTGDMSALGKGGKSDDALKWVLAPIYAPFAPGNNAKLKAGQIVNGVIEADHDVTWDAGGKAQITPTTASGPVS